MTRIDAPEYQDDPKAKDTGDDESSASGGSGGKDKWDGQYSAPTYGARPSGIATDAPGFNESSGDSGIAVDSRALQWYADRIQDLQGPVQEGRARLDAIHLAPGRFKNSVVLRAKLSGDSGVIATYSQSLQNLLPALADLADALRELARNYDTSEELSSEAAGTALGTALDSFDATSGATTAG